MSTDPNDLRVPLYKLPDFVGPKPPGTIGVELTSGEEAALIARAERKAGLPAVVLPFPEPGTPAARPSFPTGPAANDPIFSQALRFLRIGGVVVGVAVLLDKAIRTAQEDQINEEQRQRDELDRLMARRSGADNPLPVVLISSPLDRPAPEFTPPEIPDVPSVPSTVPPQITEIPGPQIEFPELTPEVVPEPVQTPVLEPVRTPGLPTDPVLNPLPDGLPSPGEAPVPLSNPLPQPSSPGRPGFGVPSPVSFPVSPPLSFPVSPPVQFPRFTPVGDPVASPGEPMRLTDFSDDPLSFTNPAAEPQPDTARRRCQDDPPVPRVACYKGLYKEGPMSDDIDFTQWAEVDCNTGREIEKSGIRGQLDNVVDLFG